MKWTRTIKILTTVLALLAALPASAQVSTSFWKLSSGSLQPVNTTWSLTIPQLGGSGTSCVQVNNSGVFSVSGVACGGGSSSTFGTSSLSAIWPIIYTQSSSLAQFSFGGLGTTTNLTVGHVPYVTGVNTFADEATSSIAAGSVISVTNGSTAYVLGSQPTITTTPGTFGGSGTYTFPNAVSVDGTVGGYQVGGTLILQGSSTVESVYLGNGAGASANGSSAYNTLLGWNAGNKITTGANNIVLGAALTPANSNITTGSNNILIGYNDSIQTAGSNNQLNVGNLIFGTSLDGSAATYSTGKIGVGSTSPFARLAIHANNNDTNKTLFAIGSSTQSATTTLFTIDNNGNVFALGSTTIAGQLNATNGATFQAFTANGLATLTGGASTTGEITAGTASSTNLLVSGVGACTNGLIANTGGAVACNGSAFLTANQTITLTGSVTGSGATSIPTAFAYPVWGGANATNFGATTISSTTQPWFKNSFFASTTGSTPSWLDQLNIGSSTTGSLSTSTDFGNFVINGNASTSQLTVSAVANALLITTTGGKVSAYGGATSCTNQAATSFNSTGSSLGCSSINNAWWSGAALAVGNGGTNDANTPSSMLLAYDNAGTTIQATSTPTAAAYIATSTKTKSIFTNASTTNLTAGTSLGIPTGSNPEPNSAGYIAQSTNSPYQLQVGTSSSLTAAIFDPRVSFTFGIATTSTWTGTTTAPVVVIPTGTTWNTVQCVTSPLGSTLNVQYQYANSSAYATVLPALIQASSTIGTFNWFTNNTPTSGATSTINFGTPAGSPVSVSCTLTGTITGI